MPSEEIRSSNKETRELNLERLQESIAGKSSGTDVISGEEYQLNDTLFVKDKTALILELKK